MQSGSVAHHKSWNANTNVHRKKLLQEVAYFFLVHLDSSTAVVHEKVRKAKTNFKEQIKGSERGILRDFQLSTFIHLLREEQIVQYFLYYYNSQLLLFSGGQLWTFINQQGVGGGGCRCKQ